MADNVLIRKCASIERCLKRIREEYFGHEDEFLTNFRIQDSVILNLQRACEASIDAAMHLVRIKKLGIPDDARQAFRFLAEKQLISSELGLKLEHMVGFRNTAVHEYQDMDMNIVRSILLHHLDDFSEFVAALLQEI